MRQIQTIFDQDWEEYQAPKKHPQEATECLTSKVKYGKHEHGMTLLASPRHYLPGDTCWDLPALLHAIEQSRHTIRLQLLSYAIQDYQGRTWKELHKSLKRAARRGVKVEILVSDWSKRPPKVEAVQNLARSPGIQVKFISIPQHSQGHIPYARTIHAKFMLVDNDWAWIGTSNFNRDYFYSSRNIGLAIKGTDFSNRLHALFGVLWRGPYAESVIPTKTYLPPRVGP